jgi:hypothetical protein
MKMKSSSKRNAHVGLCTLMRGELVPEGREASEEAVYMGIIITGKHPSQMQNNI